MKQQRQTPTWDSRSVAPCAVPHKVDWLKRTGRRVRLILTAVVLLNIGALVLDYHVTRELATHLTPMLDAVHHVNNRVVTCYLWIENYLLNNDPSGLDEVTRHLKDAYAVIEQVMEGGQVHLLPTTGEPDVELQSHWRLLQDKIRHIEALVAGIVAGDVPPRADAGRLGEYNGAIRDIIAFSEQLEALIELRINENTEWLNRLHIGGIVVLLVLVVYGAWCLGNIFSQLSCEIRHRLAAEHGLKRNRDELRVAMAARDQLLGKVSHEVRTPLNGILGLATVMEGTQPNEMQKKYLRMIESETQALWRIMDDLLDFSKLKSAGLRTNEDVVDLREILVDAVDLNVTQAEAKGILLDTELPLDIPTRLVGDSIRLRQVLLNLINNAIKFTERGTIVVGLRGELEDNLRYRVEIWVADTGIGIPGAKRRHIFEPFTQADDSATRRFGGTGLGLAICRELIELMGGDIGYEDVPEGGSRFWVRLTLSMVDDEATDSKAPQLADDPILVVDLDDAFRERTCALLRAIGATVRTADGGEEAKAALSTSVDGQRPFRALVVNDRLPDDTVRNLTDTVRADPHFADTRIYVLARNTMRVGELNATAGGTAVHVVGPRRVLDLPRLLAGDPSQERGTDPQPRPARAAAAEESPHFSGLEVLLVDDHPVAQIAGRYILESVGCRVDSAENGQQALNKWMARPYDIVFLDWQMPDIDGLEVAERIRQYERENDRIPVYLVATTANALSSDRQRCLAAGMDEYIAKPVTKEAIIRALSHFTDRRSSGT